MKPMTSHERFKRMFEHREADRIPMRGSPWGTTTERWRREGLPEDVDFMDYFGLDHWETIGVDISPRYECKTIEETDDYFIYVNSWGTTARYWKLTRV